MYQAFDLYPANPKEPQKNHRKLKQNDRPKSAAGHDRDQTTSRSLGSGCFVKFAARPVDVRNQGFQQKNKDIKGGWGLMSWKR